MKISRERCRQVIIIKNGGGFYINNLYHSPFILLTLEENRCGCAISGVGFAVRAKKKFYAQLQPFVFVVS